MHVTGRNVHIVGSVVALCQSITDNITNGEEDKEEAESNYCLLLFIWQN